MTNYIGTKRIKADPMTRGEYNKYRGWKIPKNEDPTDEGYLVEYEAFEGSKQNHEDHEGYITWSPKNAFDRAYSETSASAKEDTTKTLHNSNASGASVNVKDIIFWGNGDTFKLISKASSKAEGWMKSTKAMEIKGLGCVVQVTTQQGDNVSEAVTFVASASISETKDTDGTVIGRKLVRTF